MLVPRKSMLCSFLIRCLSPARLAMVLFAMSLTFAELAVADFSCSTEVSYGYKRGSEGERVDVKVREVRMTGPTEAAAKAELNRWTIRELSRARELCERAEGRSSSCLSTRLGAASATLTSLEFGARRAIVESMTKECAELKEICLGASSTEPKCEELAAAPAAAAEGGEKKEEGDKKGKKK